LHSTDPERPWEIVEQTSGDLFSRTFTHDCDGHRVTVRSNREYLMIQVATELDLDVCSINRKDRLGWKMFEPKLPEWFPVPVFSQATELTARQRQMLFSTELSQLIEQIGFENNESLHFYKNGLVAYLRPVSAD
jgi:hypothetical protein